MLGARTHADVRARPLWHAGPTTAHKSTCLPTLQHTHQEARVLRERLHHLNVRRARRHGRVLGGQHAAEGLAGVARAPLHAAWRGRQTRGVSAASLCFTNFAGCLAAASCSRQAGLAAVLPGDHMHPLASLTLAHRQAAWQVTDGRGEKAQAWPQPINRGPLLNMHAWTLFAPHPGFRVSLKTFQCLGSVRGHPQGHLHT